MENKPFFDRDLRIPILIGAISVIGIVMVLLIGRVMSSPAEVAATPSATPFQFLFLGTEPIVGTPLTGVSEIVPTEEVSTNVASPESAVIFTPLVTGTQSLITPTRSSVSTPVILPTAGRTATNTAPGVVVRTNTPDLALTLAITTPVDVNTYDDTDPRLRYSGSWASQTGLSGTNAPYQGTLHVSEATGSFVTFDFIGQQIELHHQAGPSLGTVTITFDNEALAIPLNQAQSNGVWTYTLPFLGVHTVTITHTSGGSVNIDKLVIPPPPATPTRTASP